MLSPVVENKGNSLALKTWPHLRDGEIEQGYDIAFASEYGEKGPVPTYPIIAWNEAPDKEDEYDWRQVSPDNWDGISPVEHNGIVVYRPTVQRATPPPPKTEEFQYGFETMQDSFQDSMILESMRRMKERSDRKKYIKYALILLVTVGVPLAIYFFYFR